MESNWDCINAPKKHLHTTHMHTLTQAPTHNTHTQTHTHKHTHTHTHTYTAHTHPPTHTLTRMSDESSPRPSKGDISVATSAQKN